MAAFYLVPRSKGSFFSPDIPPRRGKVGARQENQRRKGNLATAAANWGEVFLNAYERFLGQPSSRQMFRPAPDEPTIQVLEYKRGFPGCTMFCTLGITHYSAILGKHREVYVAVDAGTESVPFVLGATLTDILRKRERLAWGVSWTFKELFPEFVSTFSKTALYFTRPYNVPQDFAAVSLGNEVGGMLCGIFITDEENRLFMDQGAERLETHLEKHNVDPFHLSRHSATEKLYPSES
jgi:hypothetical protein